MSCDVPGAGFVECHPHDNNWVTEQLGLLPAPMRLSIADKYSKAYLEAIEANAGKIEAESLARRGANTRLRECINRFGGAYHGRVVGVPRVNS